MTEERDDAAQPAAGAPSSDGDAGAPLRGGVDAAATGEGDASARGIAGVAPVQGGDPGRLFVGDADAAGVPIPRREPATPRAPSEAQDAPVRVGAGDAFPQGVPDPSSEARDAPPPREPDALRALHEAHDATSTPGAPAVPGGSDATRPPLDARAPRDPDFERLLAEPGRFDAATALRVAEARAEASGRALRIACLPDNRLAPTAIAAAAEAPGEVRVETPLMGLVGALGPLPPAYTEIAARDRRRGAGGLGAFLDVFSGRLAMLYVAAAERHDMARLLRWHPPGRNRIVGALHALIGFGTPGMEPLRPLPEDETLRHVGVLAGRIRSAEGLRAILGSELGLPVEVEQFQLRWRRMPDEALTRLGGAQRLGDAAAAGDRAPDRGGQVRVRVGPVRYGDFLSLAEGQERLARLRRLVRLHLGPVVDFDVQVILEARDVPRTQLGGDGPAARLGWNAWARTEPARRDADEAVLGSARRGAAA